MSYLSSFFEVIWSKIKRKKMTNPCKFEGKNGGKSLDLRYPTQEKLPNQKVCKTLVDQSSGLCFLEAYATYLLDLDQ